MHSQQNMKIKKIFIPFIISFSNHTTQNKFYTKFSRSLLKRVNSGVINTFFAICRWERNDNIFVIHIRMFNYSFCRILSVANTRKQECVDGANSSTLFCTYCQLVFGLYYITQLLGPCYTLTELQKTLIFSACRL